MGYMTSRDSHTSTSELDSSATLSVFAVTFQPLQGFFNAVIFIYQKAHILRRMRANAGLNWFCAIKTVILSPSIVPERLVSSIHIATEDICERRQQGGHERMSLRERVMKNGSGLRRFGSSHGSNEADIDAASPPSIGSNSGCENSSSLGLSSNISFGDILGPDNDNDNDDDEYINFTMKDDGEIESSPLPDEENQSSMSAASSRMNISVTWSSNLSQVIPEEDKETRDQRIDPNDQS